MPKGATTIGERLRRAREDAELKQSEAAAAAGTTQHRLSMIETNKSEAIKLSVLRRLLNVLRADANEVLGLKARKRKRR